VEYHVEEVDASGLAYALLLFFCRTLAADELVSICMLGFGLTTMCTGFAQNYGGFVVTRLVLGIAEAGKFFRCC